MKTQKIIGAIIIIGIFVYLAYQALPLLIGFASNILYLSGSFIFVIIAIVVFIRIAKRFFK